MPRATLRVDECLTPGIRTCAKTRHKAPFKDNKITWKKEYNAIPSGIPKHFAFGAPES